MKEKCNHVFRNKTNEQFLAANKVKSKQDFKLLNQNAHESWNKTNVNK